MSLPILPSHRSAATNADLVRFFHQTELQWTRQIAEETPLDTGRAFTSRELANVDNANRILDASLADGGTPAAAVAEVDEHYRTQGLRCRKWVLNPAVGADRTEPLAAHLIELGYEKRTADIMHLSGRPAGTIEEVGGLQIIPARASFRHARALFEEWTANCDSPQFADSDMLHLEDPQTDALVALKNGIAAAIVSVLTVGEMGCIEDLFVSARFRHQGIGRTMMSRALEICARALFKHVFLEVACDNDSAIALYTSVGFRKVGDFISYGAPPGT